MRTCTIYALVALALTFGGGAHAQSLDASWAGCQNAGLPPQAQIEACTAVIAKEKVPENISEAYNNRAAAYVQLKQWDNALADFNNSLAHWAFLPALAGRSGMYRQTGQTELAEADEKAVLESKASTAEDLFVRGGMKKIKGDINGAISDYSAGLALNTKLPNTRWQLLRQRADAYRKLGEYDPAEADYDEMQKMTPNLPVVSFYKCNLKALLKTNLDSAEKDCTSAMDRSPIGSSIYVESSFGISVVQYDEGRYADVVASTTVQISNGPKSARLFYLRGLARNHIDGHGSDDLDTAVAFDPKIKESMNALGLGS